MTRTAFETALDAGNLQTAIQNARETRWYTCRRNGKTKTWKRDPARFEVPIKFRWRDTARARSEHFNSGEIDKWFRIAPEAPKC